MNQRAKHARGLLVGILALTVLLVIWGVAIWKRTATTADRRETAGDTSSAQAAADFFKSLAALDVEETELAARILKDAVTRESREPALWANLAVAYLRLRDRDSARDALQHALALAGRSPELALLHAELLQHSGETELAIEQLRDIHQEGPVNVAATYSLVSLLGQVRSDKTDDERLRLLSEILLHEPRNLRALCEQARLAATLKDSGQLRLSLDSLLSRAGTWLDTAKEQLAQANLAAEQNDFQNAARHLMFMENVLKPHREYQESLAKLRVSSVAAIGTPLRSFLRLQLPAAEAADADVGLTFELQEPRKTAARLDLVLASEQVGERRSTLLSLSGNALRVGESTALPFPGPAMKASRSSIAIADLNFDFEQDLILVGPQGCWIYLGSEDGSYDIHEAGCAEFAKPWRSVWTVDVEADGDLDLLLSDHQSSLRWVRNNGDLTFTSMPDFVAAEKIREVLSADLDGDGDVDLATLDTSGAVQMWRNERSGRYVAVAAPFENRRLAFAVGDVDRDGRFDLVSLSEAGGIHAATWNLDGTWSKSQLAQWPANSLMNAADDEVFLAIADIDNNGAVDLLASHRYASKVWLRSAAGRLVPLDDSPALYITSVVDMNDDGLLDLIGLTAEGGRVAFNRSQAGYAWQVLQTMANTSAGDRRINPFGVGGRIEMRAGNLVQAAVIQSPRSHFGLGRHKLADVARIVWPNGTVQAVFDLAARETLVAKQRLKGSCPWVFAFDGQKFCFVKDFIWRSPLGLRINAQDTAGVAQTEDWIKISGSQLAPANGRYSLRITAELWETHFFDHVSLLAVDHPVDVDVLVDERFVPHAPPTQQVLTVARPKPLGNVIGHRGDQLDVALRAVDGVYADRFGLGEFQGVAEEHWVEFDVPAEVASDRTVVIVGNGWIYPTDSSLNVALAQGDAGRPSGLTLEQRDARGQWHVVRKNLGFPAGKYKDVVIALPGGCLSSSRRFRLRTNMEVYWDSLGWSYELTDAPTKVTRLPVSVGDLRHRGYSKLLPIDRRRPDTPVYEIEATEPRWLDLEGYYTRYGDVRELLATVDDRYVIMNAGDELVFEFEASQDVASGWRRDFVLVGDGWVKDGDLNTAFSRWVRPLPTHDHSDYAGPLTPLEVDPVYQRHAEDWRLFHTRYITPRRFQRGLWPPSAVWASGAYQR